MSNKNEKVNNRVDSNQKDLDDYLVGNSVLETILTQYKILPEEEDRDTLLEIFNMLDVNIYNSGQEDVSPADLFIVYENIKDPEKNFAVLPLWRDPNNVLICVAFTEFGIRFFDVRNLSLLVRSDEEIWGRYPNPFWDDSAIKIGIDSCKGYVSRSNGDQIAIVDEIKRDTLQKKQNIKMPCSRNSCRTKADIYSEKTLDEYLKQNPNLEGILSRTEILENKEDRENLLKVFKLLDKYLQQQEFDPNSSEMFPNKKASDLFIVFQEQDCAVLPLYRTVFPGEIICIFFNKNIGIQKCAIPEYFLWDIKSLKTLPKELEESEDSEVLEVGNVLEEVKSASEDNWDDYEGESIVNRILKKREVESHNSYNRLF